MQHHTAVLLRLLLAATTLLTIACSEDESNPHQADPDTNNASNNSASNHTDNNTNNNTNNSAPNDTNTADTGPRRGAVTHDFGEFELEPFEESTPCIAWTLNNDAPLYVEAISLSNFGSFHHSNWFVVPEDNYTGPDGLFNCSERGFSELGAAIAGTVIFAQSTQSQLEEQRLGEGIVIKIPPRHKVVAGLHLLNFLPRAHTTELRMSLEAIHPGDVDIVVSPFRIGYRALDIPARSEARFKTECDLTEIFGDDVEMKLHWLLPHYHELGNHFSLRIMGGPRDGEELLSLSEFNAEANGKSFDPPLDLAGSQGLQLTCGFNNPRDESVGWGIGDQEMCLMLGFAEMGVLFDGNATSNEVVGEEDGRVLNTGACDILSVPKNRAQSDPTEEERAGALILPASDDQDNPLPPLVECADADTTVAAQGETTLSDLQATVIAPSCTFSACHDMTSPAQGLDLASPGLHQRLLDHQVQANTDMPLIKPGDPDQSWLYHLMTQCEPTNSQGEVVSRMPIGGASLLDNTSLARLRTWIADGAQDN